MRRLVTAIGVSLCLVGSTRAPLVEEGEFIDAKPWLAKACIAEEGWGDFKGCAAVLYTYLRRTEQIKNRGRDVTLRGVVRSHSAPLRADRPKRSARAQLIVNLPDSGNQRQKETFQRTLQFVEDWQRGRVQDPCDDHTVDFGGHMDRKPRHHRLVRCSGATSLFYVYERTP